MSDQVNRLATVGLARGKAKNPKPVRLAIGFRLPPDPETLTESCRRYVREWRRMRRESRARTGPKEIDHD